MTPSVFISHSTKDDAIVTALRERLEPRGIRIWADSRELAAGDLLAASIAEAIDSSTHLIAVLSQNAVNSHWVKKEIRHALRTDREIKVIPLLIDPIDSGALGLWFEQEPVALKLEIGPGGIDAALPDHRVPLFFLDELW